MLDSKKLGVVVFTLTTLFLAAAGYSLSKVSYKERVAVTRALQDHQDRLRAAEQVVKVYEIALEQSKSSKQSELEAERIKVFNMSNEKNLEMINARLESLASKENLQAERLRVAEVEYSRIKNEVSRAVVSSAVAKDIYEQVKEARAQLDILRKEIVQAKAEKELAEAAKKEMPEAKAADKPVGSKAKTAENERGTAGKGPGEAKSVPGGPTAFSYVKTDSDRTMVLGFAGGVSLLALTFAFIIIISGSSEDSKKWAMGILGTIIGFWLGIPK